MNNKTFKLWNRLVAVLMLIISATVYLLTIEPTASFWDCGEFIASSYKLEVGHPPGNPVFQLFARFFSMFTGPENAAMAVNAFSAICSAFTIFFLYLTIVFFAKRLIKPASDGAYSLGKAIAIFGSGAIGALVYTFTDTFWFSAVEGEVYAMSSLITALVFWAMIKWYEQADQPHSNRWIVLISFLMGLSIGIHLLNLLAIPALVFLFYYKRREDGHYSFVEYLKIFLISVVILAVILYGIIPFLPKFAAYIDLLFVNKFGLPFNMGAVFVMLLLLVLCFWGIYRTMRNGRVLLNTALLCFTMIVIGFSMFSIVVIRSSAKTPTNEYQPDNPFTLIRYLGREQYGSNPLIYGQYFDAEYELEETDYWAPMGDKYINVSGPVDAKYKSEGKMLFPRMWSSAENHKEVYLSYMNDSPGNPKVEQQDEYGNVIYRKPTFFENLSFFFDYQMNWMYWRYFMWNFAGRQNDIHSPSPGDPFIGNWECGIPFIDELRLGDQSDAPDYLKNNKGKNHYYMLPLLLGLIGIFFQFARDKRGCWVTFLMFFMTGIAIVVYLNQPPYQVRERDYAYAGSFYAFSIWIGLAVAAAYSLLKQFIRPKKSVILSSCITVSMLSVPVLMAVENWDDHDRSNRYTAVEMAKNYLNSVGHDGILVTHGDNDTFPLWYAQEVEGVRPDVRIANTSLLGTDWHIDQMKWAMNESSPLDLSLNPRQYLYGTNEILYVMPMEKDTMHISELAEHFAKDTRLYVVSFYDHNSGEMKEDYMSFPSDNPDLKKYRNNMGRYGIDDIRDMGLYVPARNFILPVNKENVIKYGILDEKYIDKIPDQIVISIPESKRYITKPELFMLDFLSNYQWDRPLNLLSMGGDINIGLKDYLMYEGFSYKFVPVKNKMKSTEIGFADPDDLYYKMKNVFTWDALKRTDYFADYQNHYTFCGVLSQRTLFLNVAKEMIKAGDNEKAIEMLDMCMECVPEEVYPFDMHYLGFSNEYILLEIMRVYMELGQSEKAVAMAEKMMDSFVKSRDFFLQFDYSYEDAAQIQQYINWIIDMFQIEIDKLDVGKDASTALMYLDLCEKWLKDDLSNNEGWYHLIRQSLDFSQFEEFKALADKMLPRMMYDISELIAELGDLQETYSLLVADYMKQESDYRREISNSRPVMSKVNRLQARINELNVEINALSEEFNVLHSNYIELDKYINSIIALLENHDYTESAKKYFTDYAAIQSQYQNLMEDIQ